VQGLRIAELGNLENSTVERQRSAQQQGGVDARGLAAELDSLLAVERDLLSGEALAARARQLNAVLRKVSGGGEAESRALLRVLEERGLEGLFDEEGRSCRAEAVEALLRLGYPYALYVHPDDLEHLRLQRPHRLRRWAGVGLAAALAGTAGVWLSVMDAPGAAAAAALSAGLGLAAAGRLLRRRARSRRPRNHQMPQR
jgi:hypothetical protein